MRPSTGASGIKIRKILSFEKEFHNDIKFLFFRCNLIDTLEKAGLSESYEDIVFVHVNETKVKNLIGPHTTSKPQKNINKIVVFIQKKIRSICGVGKIIGFKK